MLTRLVFSAFFGIAIGFSALQIGGYFYLTFYFNEENTAIELLCSGLAYPLLVALLGKVVIIDFAGWVFEAGPCNA